jgi:hypothetical protein
MGAENGWRVVVITGHSCPINADPAQLAETGTPQELEAWRSIRPAVAQLDAIGVIARRFGPRSLDFGVLDRPPLIDCMDLTDDALMCSADDIVQAGKVFRARTADIRSAPWLRITPKLCTIAEAKERLRAWSEQEWNLLNAGRVVQRHNETGELEDVVINNPYALKETVTQ